jgi:hypothetical protein
MAGRVGRPAAGRDGAKVREYQRFTLRLSPEGIAMLNALSAVSGLARWSVIEAALEAYPDHFEDGQRRLIRQLARSNLARLSGGE